MKLAHILAGRKEAALLTCPSVYRMAEVLMQRCRDERWVCLAVAGLARFSAITGFTDLEELRVRALAQPALAEEVLATFAHSLAAYSASQVAALAMGAKLWFRLNGIAVPWHPLPGRPSATAPVATLPGVESVILLALSSSGLHLAELLRLRMGDVGSLDINGCLLPDIEADPLAIQYTSLRSKRGERLTFLSYQAHQLLLLWLAPAICTGHFLDPAQPLLSDRPALPLLRTSIAHARRRGRAVIQAGNQANVELCRATGDFFRHWGLPGSRFTGPEELDEEEFF